MAMQRQNWSINGLAAELGIDRRTLAKRLQDLPPAQDEPRTYTLRAVLDHLRQWQDGLPDLEQVEKVNVDQIIETVIVSMGEEFRKQLPKTLQATGSTTQRATEQTEASMMAYSFLAFTFANAVEVTDKDALKNIAQLGQLGEKAKKKG